MSHKVVLNRFLKTLLKQHKKVVKIELAIFLTRPKPLCHDWQKGFS